MITFNLSLANPTYKKPLFIPFAKRNARVLFGCLIGYQSGIGAKTLKCVLMPLISQHPIYA
jgi:hypothetical protein